MKIFLSWSGSQSRKVARVLRAWIPQVIQSIEPFVSSVDIDKGSRWREILKEELGTSDIGILCLTRSNKDQPWLTFEAGALSKGAIARVCPFLLDFDESELSGPLAEYQATVFSRADVGELLRALNKQLGSKRLDDKRLETSFDTFWPDLEEKLNRILEPDPADILASSYQETVDQLSQAERIIKRTRNRLFQDILIRELADFRAKLKRWQQKKIVLVDHHYDDFVEKAYASARRSVFATCSEGDIDSWMGRAGERLLAAHRKSPANVTRVFVFESRQDVSEQHLEVARWHHREGFEVWFYINDEDDFFHFPPDLSKDFVIVDDGLIIGKSSHRRKMALSEWTFNDRTEADRFKGYKSRLLRGCVPETDDLSEQLRNIGP